MEWLQSWYRAQCNGEWEHQFGVSVETLDNPGWLVKIDLIGTPLQNLQMQAFSAGAIDDEEDQEWLHCKIEANRFEGAGGPLSLSRICAAFRNWVESNQD